MKRENFLSDGISKKTRLRLVDREKKGIEIEGRVEGWKGRKERNNRGKERESEREREREENTCIKTIRDKIRHYLKDTDGKKELARCIQKFCNACNNHTPSHQLTESILFIGGI